MFDNFDVICEVGYQGNSCYGTWVRCDGMWAHVETRFWLSKRVSMHQHPRERFCLNAVINS